MLSRILALAALLITLMGIWAAYTQSSALLLRQETQPLYWPRYGTLLSGRYRNQSWQATPSRSSYGGFRGGGPSAGK